jgi:hypothetical protein
VSAWARGGQQAEGGDPCQGQGGQGEQGFPPHQRERGGSDGSVGSGHAMQHPLPVAHGVIWMDHQGWEVQGCGGTATVRFTRATGHATPGALAQPLKV